jgi:hypothetical protein
MDNNDDNSNAPRRAQPTDTERVDWIQHMAAECEGHILTRLFLPDGKPFREKVDAAMKLNPQ